MSNPANTIIRLSISLRWWFKPYLWGLATVAYLTGRTPDRDKVERVVSRAVVVKAQPVRLALAA